MGFIVFRIHVFIYRYLPTVTTLNRRSLFSVQACLVHPNQTTTYARRLPRTQTTDPVAQLAW